MLDLSKFANDYVLRLEGAIKYVYEDDFEKGEIGNGFSLAFDWIDKYFYINEDFTKDDLTELIVNHLRNNFYCNEIERNWIMVNDNRITLHLYEDEDSDIITNVKEYFERGEKVFSCYYDMKMYINNKRLDEDDLIELFNFEN